MAREDDTRPDDPYRPDATPPGATDETQEAARARAAGDDAMHDRDRTTAPAADLDPAAKPGTVPPSHSADSPSSGAHAAVEAPRDAKSRKTLLLVLGAVVLVALAFLLLGFGAEEAEDAAPSPVDAPAVATRAYA